MINNTRPNLNDANGASALLPRRSKSPLAEQQASVSPGSILAKIQAKAEHRPSWSIFKKIEMYFIKRSVREQFITEVRNNFCMKATAQRRSAYNAYLLFEKAFRPFLEECPFKDLPFFESLLTTKSFNTLSREKQKLLFESLKTLPLVNQLIGGLSPQGKQEYVQAWIENANELNAEDFKQFLKQYTTHLQDAEHLQSLRPFVYDQSSPEQTKLALGFFEFFNEPVFQNPANRLAPFDSALRDLSAIGNRQILQYSIAALYMGATDRLGQRTIPILIQRTSQYGLTNQIGIPLILNGPDEEMLNELPMPEVYLTNPTTMETRAVRVPLPFKYPISVGEAKKRLELLKIYLGTPKRFNKEMIAFGIPETERESLQAAFLEYDAKLAVAFGNALGDFNSTPTRSRETTARSQPATAALIQNPYSQSAAIQAAQSRNLFLLKDGTLSLLPSGPGENHRQIGTISSKEYQAAADVFSGKSKRSLTIEIPVTTSDRVTLKKGGLTLTVREEKVGDNQNLFLILETTITLEGKSTTRTTYYAAEIEGKTVDQVKQEIVSSRLLERDLLLAKSALIERTYLIKK